MTKINGDDFGIEHLIVKLELYGGSEDLKIRVKNLHEELYEMGYEACLFERDDEFEWCLRETFRIAYEKGHNDGSQRAFIVSPPIGNQEEK